MAWQIEKLHKCINNSVEQYKSNPKDTPSVHKLLDDLYEASKEFDLPEPIITFNKEEGYSFDWWICPIGGYKYTSGVVRFWFISHDLYDPSEPEEKVGIPLITFVKGLKWNCKEYNDENLKEALQFCKECIDCNELV